MIVTNMDVKKLVDHSRAPRDRAIILTMFQGGMDVSTLCSLKYGDVAEGNMLLGWASLTEVQPL